MEQVPKRKGESVNIPNAVNITEETECLGKGITHSAVRETVWPQQQLYSSDLIKC